MKLMFASDIHGSRSACEAVLRQYQQEKAERLVLLGDLLYHGPRNNLPDEYDPKGVIALLNGVKNELFCVRGNCDAEVDQMLLQFPIMADYALVVEGGRRFFLTHGHVYNEDNAPVMKNDVFVYGHTHLWKLEPTDDNRIVCNLGSITFPKGGNVPTFATYEDGVMAVRTMDGDVLKEVKL